MGIGDVSNVVIKVVIIMIIMIVSYDDNCFVLFIGGFSGCYVFNCLIDILIEWIIIISGDGNVVFDGFNIS